VRTLAWILCLAACDAGEKPAPPAAPQPAPTVKQPVVVGADLTYLPAESDLMIHIDVTRLRKSKLWPTYAPDLAKLLVPAFASCGDSALGQLATVDIGIVLAAELEVYVFRGLDRDNTLACLRAKSETRTTTFDGDFVTVTSKNGANSVLTFVDARTMVMQGAKQTKQTLQHALQAGADAPLGKNEQFAAVLNKAGRSAAMTIASRPGSESITAQMAIVGVKVSHLWGTLDAGDRLELHYAMVVGSADEANKLGHTMEGQLHSPQVKQMFDHIGARTQGDTVSLDVVLSEAKLASLVAMLRPMMRVP
jgi:hypothetical protein